MFLLADDEPGRVVAVFTAKDQLTRFAADRGAPYYREMPVNDLPAFIDAMAAFGIRIAIDPR